MVVYESMYGNTEEIAEAIAVGLGHTTESACVEVSSAPTDLADVDLVAVGAPTQGFTMSTKDGRARLVEEGGEVISAGIGVRDWLKQVDWSAAGVVAAAFDTRFDKPRAITGSAARAIEKRLRRHKVPVAAPAESFFVDHGEGPLKDGEIDRATAWGAALASELTRVAPG
jgi:flavodoxin